MPRTKKPQSTVPHVASDAITSIKYPAKRKNIPPAGLEAQGVLKDTPKIRYEYNPHLPPVLRSAPYGDCVYELLYELFCEAMRNSV